METFVDTKLREHDVTAELNLNFKIEQFRILLKGETKLFDFFYIFNH